MAPPQVTAVAGGGAVLSGLLDDLDALAPSPPAGAAAAGSGQPAELNVGEEAAAAALANAGGDADAAVAMLLTAGAGEGGGEGAGDRLLAAAERFIATEGSATYMRVKAELTARWPPLRALVPPAPPTRGCATGATG